MTNQKETRREKRQKVKRKKQMQSVGMMVIGLLIIVAGIVIVSVSKPRVATASEENYLNVDRNAIGNPDAPVVIEEFFSFSCSHCQAFAIDSFPRLLEDYINKGIVYYISRPISFGGSTDAVGIASQAVYCAADQGKYFEMHDTIFANFSPYGYQASQLESMADNIGLDLDQYDACMSNGDHITTVDGNLNLAVESGINSTPNFLVNGLLAIVGNKDYSFFQQQIELALASAGQ
jgi:protein-disulfide isomerase